jgi:hypothetical protein
VECLKISQILQHLEYAPNDTDENQAILDAESEAEARGSRFENELQNFDTKNKKNVK